MKIKKSEIDKMIKEEFQKMLEKKKLSNRLSQINESLDAMDAEDEGLDEVKAGGETKVASHAWTGKADGDVKFKPEFEKKGSSLLEDEEDSIEVGAEDSIEGPEMGAEMGAEVEEAPMGEFEAKFAEIGKAIDAKMAGGEATETPGEEAAEMGAENSDEDFEEVEVSDDNAGVEGAEDTEEVEVDEYAEVNGGVGAEQGMTAADANKEEVHESVDEPLEGHSVAQEVEADKVNDNMEKDKHVKEGKKKEGAVITEAKKPEAKNIFTEGLDVKKKTALLEEMNRMKKFAGLSKDEE
jgi:hypothetical protein